MGRSKIDLFVFVVKRVVWLVPVVFGLITITFFAGHASVRNPCAVWVGPHASPDTVRQCNEYFGVNLPVWDQYTSYVSHLLGGDWGKDPGGGRPVLRDILTLFPATIELLLAALFLMIVIGIPLGVIAANRSGRWPDHLVRLFYLGGWATPAYLAAVVLAIGVGPILGLPNTGDFSSTPDPGWQLTHMSLVDSILRLDPGAFVDAIAHLILPATALAFLNLGIATRMTRSSMLEVLPLDYVKTARMKGLSDFWVLYKHALRNSLISTVTVLGTTAGSLLSWIVVIEEIFLWPGIGKYAFDAILSYNFPGALGVVVFFAIVVVIANLISDVLYGVLDPRVEWR
jgi:peptide/nickel transport system permease protein